METNDEKNRRINQTTVIGILMIMVFLAIALGDPTKMFGNPVSEAESTNFDFGLNSVVIDGEVVHVVYWNNSDELCPGIYDEVDELLSISPRCPATGPEIRYQTSITNFSNLEVGMKVKLCDLSGHCSETITVQGNAFTKNCYGDFAVAIKFEGAEIVDTTCIEDGYSLSFTINTGEQFNITVSEDFQQLGQVTVGTTERASVFCTDEGSDQSRVCYSDAYAFEVKITALKIFVVYPSTAKLGDSVTVSWQSSGTICYFQKWTGDVFGGVDEAVFYSPEKAGEYDDVLTCAGEGDTMMTKPIVINWID